MYSIIIPAHNEQDVIGRCLRSLTSDMVDGEFEIIVVCNACRDRTAEIATAFGPPVRVIETSQAGKPLALNLGDAEARHFPRLYVDADVEMTAASARRVAAVLSSGEALCAAPRLEVNMEGRSWPIRAYYGIWRRLPYGAQEHIGSGVYALSREGRARFDRFPDLMAEDDYIRMTFSEGERKEVLDAEFRIDSPTSFRSLLKIRQRWARTAMVVKKQHPDLKRNDKRNYARSLGRVLIRPDLWPAMMLYVGIVAYTRTVGWYQLRFTDTGGVWHRDQSSRQHVGRMQGGTTDPSRQETAQPYDRTT